MSAGAYLKDGRYENDQGVIHPIRVQPETASLTLNSVANALPATQPAANLPSVRVGGGRRQIGINARLVRFTITDAMPPSDYLANGVLTLPVLTIAAFAAYGKNQIGTYTLGGTAYAVAFVGKTPETII